MKGGLGCCSCPGPDAPRDLGAAGLWVRPLFFFFSSFLSPKQPCLALHRESRALVCPWPPQAWPPGGVHPALPRRTEQCSRALRCGEWKLAQRRWKGARFPVSFSQGRDSRGPPISSPGRSQQRRQSWRRGERGERALARPWSGPRQVHSRRHPTCPWPAGQPSGAFPCFTDTSLCGACNRGPTPPLKSRALWYPPRIPPLPHPLLFVKTNSEACECCPLRAC